MKRTIGFGTTATLAILLALIITVPVFAGDYENSSSWFMYIDLSDDDTVLTIDHSGAAGSVQHLERELVEVLWLQPQAIVTSSTIPDRRGGDNPGIIDWGSNPAGVAVSIGALLPEEQAVGDVEEASEVPSLVPDTGGIETDVSGVEGTNFPLYGFFKGLLDSWNDLGGPNISMPYFWRVVAVLAGWTFGTAVMLSTRNVVFGLVAYIVGFVVPAVAMGGVLDIWVPIVYVIGSVSISLLTAKWGTSSM